MADYDAIDEEQGEDESLIIELPDLPLPAAGQINYNREKDGEDEFYLK